MKFVRANAPGRAEGSGFRAASDDSGDREVVTVRPPFDPVEFARESESKLQVQEDGAAGNRPTVPPPPGLPGYVCAIGPHVIPELVVAREDLEWFDLTPEARKVLQFVDGQRAVSAICDQVSRPANDVIGELERLAGEGLVSWR
jgi:hypothetical protein